MVMPPGRMLRHICELAEKLGCEVRMGELGGTGGLCEIRGAKVLFVDTSVELIEQAEQAAEAICGEPGIDDVYVLPEVREYLRKIHHDTSC